MNILALIPARGGSKRVQRKNIKMLAGKPLISWTIEVAKNASNICQVIVSTDDIEIAKIAESYEISVPWLRPLELSTDNSNSEDVAIHALDWFESNFYKVDGLLLLQPTSPFRSAETIDRGVRLYIENNNNTVIGVSEISQNQKNLLYIKNDRLFFDAQTGKEKQCYVNGCFYLISPENLRENKKFVVENSIPLIIQSQSESLDIDTNQDFAMAEKLARKFTKYN